MNFLTTMKTSKTVTSFKKKGNGPKIPIIKTIEEEAETAAAEAVTSKHLLSQLNTKKYVPDPSCPNEMLKKFCPTPSDEIKRVFEFYFKPQSYIINTQKYMDYTKDNPEK
jgi:hypothetical protein